MTSVRHRHDAGRQRQEIRKMAGGEVSGGPNVQLRAPTRPLRGMVRILHQPLKTRQRRVVADTVWKPP
jgi:hypothetical protein